MGLYLPNLQIPTVLYFLRSLPAFWADKSYDTDKSVGWIKTHGGIAVIPSRRSARHPRKIDWDIYKERHLTKNLLLKFKNRRRFSTRYEKNAFYFRAVAYLVCIVRYNKRAIRPPYRRQPDGHDVEENKEGNHVRERGSTQAEVNAVVLRSFADFRATNPGLVNTEILDAVAAAPGIGGVQHTIAALHQDGVLVAAGVVVVSGAADALAPFPDAAR